MNNIKIILGISTIAIFVGVFIAFETDEGRRHITDASKAHATVEIVNNQRNSGGSGVVLDSTPFKSRVLTNRHVCKLVESGGLVVSDEGQPFQVAAVQESQSYDLCVITVNADLNDSTALADGPPSLYSECEVSGHPLLLPTIVTKGHFSRRAILPIMVSPFEVVLTPLQVISATIQPGSSGSAVYNSKGELAGLVEAGSGTIGYGMIVPFEFVLYFLKSELPTINAIVPNLNASTPLDAFKMIKGQIGRLL